MSSYRTEIPNPFAPFGKDKPEHTGPNSVPPKGPERTQLPKQQPANPEKQNPLEHPATTHPSQIPQHEMDGPNKIPEY